jgi:hypothetical protein
MRVGAARKKAGVDYPNMYAYAGDSHVYKHGKGEHQNLTSHMAQDIADDYNSVQRAHQNTVENHAL